MTNQEAGGVIIGILTGLKKAKEIFRTSTDAKGGCNMLSQGGECNCFLCLCDAEIERAEQELTAH